MTPARSTATVRRARTDELAAVAGLTVAVYLPDGFTTEDSPYLADLGDAARRAREAEVLVARVRGTVAGSVTFAPHGSPWAELAGPDESEFRMLVVSPDARGRGVGEALVRACIDRARGRGDRVLVLSTQAEMADAHRLYRRLGFRRNPARDWTPVPGIHLRAFALPLT